MKLSRFAREPRQTLFRRFIQQFADGFDELWKIQRLFHQRTNTGRQRREKLVWSRGNNDDGQKRIFGGETLKGVPAVLDRQIQIEQHQVYLGRSRHVQRFLAVGGGQHDVSFLG